MFCPTPVVYLAKELANTVSLDEFNLHHSFDGRMDNEASLMYFSSSGPYWSPRLTHGNVINISS